MMSESDHENDTMAASKKKRRLNDNDSDFVVSEESEYESSDDVEEDESGFAVDFGSDAENNNHSNSNENAKDIEIKRLKKELKIMTEKYNQMKADNIKLRKKMKATPAKSSKNSNNQRM